MRFVAVGVCLVLAACNGTTSSGVEHGPNGKPVYIVEGWPADNAFKEAARRCPAGYEILKGPDVKHNQDYVITVECK